MSYEKRRNADRRAHSKNTEALRHLRHARRARLQQVSEYATYGIEASNEKFDSAANNAIDWITYAAEQAKEICDLIVSQS